MAPRIIVIWTLLLQTLWIGVFVLASRYFTPEDLRFNRIAKLEKNISDDAKVIAKLELSFNEYKDTVAAAGLHIKENSAWTDSNRMVASVLADRDFKLVPHTQVDALREFEKGRNYYLDGNYRRASEIFESFIQDHSENLNLPTVTYLLGESYFNLGQIEPTLRALDLLITHFPETELSGYGLVRLGKIFNQESRPEDAAEIFRAVIEYYPKSNAALLASKNLKELPL